MSHARRLATAACFLTCALALLATAAAAQEAPAAPVPRQGACHADVQRLCSAAKGTPGGVAQCLHEKRDELSQACREQIEAHAAGSRQAAARVREACSDEMARFCPDFTPGRGGLMRCLRSHQTELSAGCQAALAERARGTGTGSAPAPPVPAP